MHASGRATASGRRLRRAAAAAVALVLAAGWLIAPASASANVGHKIIRLCEEGKPIGGFSEKDYIQAMSEVEAYGVEYEECPEQIEEAELAVAGIKRRGGSKGVGGSTSVSGPGGSSGSGLGIGSGATGAPGEALATTPEERRQIARARSGTAPVELGHGAASTIHPGVVHANLASAISSLPTPLLAMLAALIAMIVVLAGWAIRERTLSADHSS